MTTPYFRPWLWLPPQIAHEIAPKALQLLCRVLPKQEFIWKPFQWRSLHFRNRWGIAGGVDKNGEALKSWHHLGAGFLEAGTITPLPQSANPGVVLMRNLPGEALWNRMGFPNKGLAYFRDKLLRSPPLNVPILANIGKNRTTLNHEAHNDYITCMKGLFDLVDGFVINISSPNTESLRTLQEKDHLEKFLEPISQCRAELPNHPPLLLKMSPDLTDPQLDDLLDVSLGAGVDGWVLTNTTSSRIGLDLGFPQEGGVSGRPLALQSKSLLKKLTHRLGGDRKDRLIISVGGISSVHDVQERLDLGADLVEIYSALIFEGPLFFRKIFRELNS